MRLLNVIDEDIVNYKKISMYIAFPNCSMKCNIDAGKNICQNSELLKSEVLNISGDELIKRYLGNRLSHAIVLGGLEPLDSYFDIVPFVAALRTKYDCDDDIVVYTGYTEDELEGRTIFEYEYKDNISLQPIVMNVYSELKKYKNVIVKFGRYKEGDKPHFDEVLGVNLASSNQYAKFVGVK